MDNTEQVFASHKFNPGQVVRPVGVKYRDGAVVSMSFSAEKGWVYQVEAKEWDAATRSLVNGISHFGEAEIELAPEAVAAQ